MEITTEKVKQFLQDVAHPVWKRDGTLRKNRPIQYTITKIIDPKKRSTKFVIDFETINLNNQPTKEIIFSVTQKSFKGDVYDFSAEWQKFIQRIESANVL